MDIFSILEEFTDEQTMMKNHPLKEAEENDKKGLLYGIALLMNADAEISDSEKKYLSSLIRSLSLDDALLNDFVEFAKNPRKEELALVQGVLKNEVYRLPFFADSIMLAHQDGNFSEEEEKVIEQFRTLSGLQKDVLEALKKIVNVIATQERKEIYSAIVNSPIDRKNILHLLDYRHISQEGLEYTNTTGIEFVYIPSGEFMMGASQNDSEASDDEKPQHKVKLTRAFYMSKTPITQKQWQAVMGNNPSNFKGEDRPVECVSWDDAQAFVRKLNEKEGRGGTADKPEYRLPTEAEWEYAARAGTTTKYYWGDQMDGAFGWYDGNAGNQTQTIKKKLPNHWGLYDMLGNVWEWCEDWYDGIYYKKSASENPANLSSGVNRVLRGGSWSVDAGSLRVSYRFRRTPDYRDRYYGFRLVRTVEF